ncbi:MAG TPA: 30S ribosomal protein S11 [Candidatus Saccharimonadia bacterium]|nr:30S ribosomal protein S11 [Candidatus Saccharimonadia bacterium]
MEDKSTKKPIEQPKTAEEPVVVKKKKKAKRSVDYGQVHIQSTFNNTIVTFTDPKGNVLVTTSAGACGFRGSKKSTAFAAQIAMDKASDLVRQTYGLSKVDVLLKGLGLGRDSAVRALQNANIFVESITDVSGLPHGGCRARKARRV